MVTVVSVRVEFRWDEGLLERVDGALGPGQPRADFVRRAVVRALAEQDVADRYGLEPPEAVEQVPGEFGEAEDAGIGGRGAGAAGVPVARDALLASSSASPEPVTPAPAEQPRRPYRLSGQAKREVRPVPKGTR